MNVEQIEQKNQQGRFASLKTWAKLLPFLKPYSRNMAVILSLMLVSAGCDLAYPLLSGYAVDHFVTPRQSQGVGWYALGYMAVVLAQMLCTMIFARSALKVEMYLGRDLKKRLFTHLQTLSFSYYNTTPVGTIMARVMSDTNRIGSVFAWSLVDIFWSAAYVIGCMGVMLFLNWRLALLVIVVVPAIALLTLYFQKKILAINRQARKVNAEITRHYNEGISGAKTSKTLVIEDKNTAAFQEVTQRMRRTTVRGVLLNAVYVPIIGFLTALAVAFVLTGGGSMVLWGDIGIGELTVFVNFAWSSPTRCRPWPAPSPTSSPPRPTSSGSPPCWSCGRRSPTPQRSSRNTAPPLPPSGKTGSPLWATSPLRTSPSATPTAPRTCWSTSAWTCPRHHRGHCGRDRRGQIHPGEPGLPVLRAHRRARPHRRPGLPGAQPAVAAQQHWLCATDAPPVLRLHPGEHPLRPPGRHRRGDCGRGQAGGRP